MAATVLNSSQAVMPSLFVLRAFVQLRRLLGTHQQLAASGAEARGGDAEGVSEGPRRQGVLGKQARI